MPRTGVASVTVSEIDRDAKAAEHAPRRFRVELLAEDHAVDYVMAALSFAVSAGLIGRCESAWITPAQGLSRPSSADDRLVGA
jgi:hypothetical protein